jgi:hypothetical protein
MARWATPQQGTWSAAFLWVCFNDACPYFIRGWSWMRERFNVRASYRFRADPVSGETGPLPVWSKDALKSSILPDKESLDA